MGSVRKASHCPSALEIPGSDTVMEVQGCCRFVAVTSSDADYSALAVHKNPSCLEDRGISQTVVELVSVESTRVVCQ